MVSTKNEEEAGELLWILLEKEMKEDEDKSEMRSLRIQSNITMEKNGKRNSSKLTIRVGGEHHGKVLITEVWRLLKKVFYKTGIFIVPVYNKNITTSS